VKGADRVVTSIKSAVVLHILSEYIY